MQFQTIRFQQSAALLLKLHSEQLILAQAIQLATHDRTTWVESTTGVDDLHRQEIHRF